MDCTCQSIGSEKALKKLQLNAITDIDFKSLTDQRLKR